MVCTVAKQASMHACMHAAIAYACVRERACTLQYTNVTPLLVLCLALSPPEGDRARTRTAKHYTPLLRARPEPHTRTQIRRQNIVITAQLVLCICTFDFCNQYFAR